MVKRFPPFPETARRQDSERRGRLAEHIAAWWLRLKGYRLLEKRVRTPVGEIDLIVKRGPLTCFVEVKQRKTIAEALSAIPKKQRERIVKASAWWLSRKNSSAFTDFRFDVIAIVPGHLPRHISDAWRPDE